jgi:hypothetical protein
MYSITCHDFGNGYTHRDIQYSICTVFGYTQSHTGSQLVRLKKGPLPQGIQYMPFKQSVEAGNRVGIGLSTGPPGYIGWRN